MKHARNKKVPRKRQLSRGTSNKIQFDPIMEYLKSQGRLMKQGILGLNRLAQILYIEVKGDGINVQLTEDDFRRLFGEQRRKTYLEEYDYMFMQQAGVEFYCLAGRRK